MPLRVASKFLAPNFLPESPRRSFHLLVLPFRFCCHIFDRRIDESATTTRRSQFLYTDRHFPYALTMLWHFFNCHTRLFRLDSNEEWLLSLWNVRCSRSSFIDSKFIRSAICERALWFAIGRRVDRPIVRRTLWSSSLKNLYPLEKFSKSLFARELFLWSRSNEKVVERSLLSSGTLSRNWRYRIAK